MAHLLWVSAFGWLTHLDHACTHKDEKKDTLSDRMKNTFKYTGRQSHPHAQQVSTHNTFSCSQMGGKRNANYTDSIDSDLPAV